MSTVEHPEPNTTVATLNIGSENPSISRDDVIDYIERELNSRESAPSGATITKGIGLWKGDREENLIVEIWIDTEEELEAVRQLKADIEEEYSRFCVCLGITDKYYEH